ncbi:hypothetical protein [Actinomadura sp. WMMA1423]|uniref:hypothetical protein n=1 Tax=Actinomadura sp. WMMA1423 TaxID=2591108 RepID=UPI0011476021|nr:hypothetical protein [Actinomadura sp. WMMA1423]
MSGLEDRLRDALRASAGMVDADKPRPFPEPRARAPRPALPGRAAAPRRGVPSRRWVVPVCAVLAVLVLAAGIVGVRKMMEPDRRLQKVPTMPRFYFASYLAGGGDPSRVEVRDSRTGRLLDAKPAPKGTNFLNLAAAGDGRTLYVLKRTRAVCATRVEKMSVSEAGAIVRSSEVVGSAVSGEPPGQGSLAVTPDGRGLAYSVVSCADPPVTRIASDARIAILDAVSGNRREWREPSAALADQLSWAGRGDRLFFVRSRYKGPEKTVQELRSLPMGGDGAPSAAAPPIRTLISPRAFEGVAAAADGRRVFVIEGSVLSISAESGETAGPGADTSSFSILELSADDGRVLRSIRRRSVSFAGDPVMKGDATGRYLATGFGLVDLGKPDAISRIRIGEDFYDLDW